MRSILFDIETDDVAATKIWCMCAIDLDTGEEFSFPPHKLNEGYKLLKTYDKLVGHNIIGFDIPVIKRIHGVDLSDKKLVDTLVLSRLFNPVREGNHSLKNWGFILGGKKKLEFKEFSRYSDAMLNYCMHDVRLNVRVYNALKKESKGFSRESVDLELDTFKIICQQREDGFLLDEEAAKKTLSEIQGKMAEVVERVKERFLPREETMWLYPTYTNAGRLSKMALNNLGKNVRLTKDEYECMKNKLKASNDSKLVKVPRINKTEFNLGSRQQIGKYLIDFGWKPKSFTPTGQPEINESILSKVKDIPEAKLISDYLMYQKRVSQIEPWIDAVQEDGRVRGYVNSNGTITGRMSHSDPNLGQVVSVNSPYGKECRACWVVPNNKRLVGIDASGLELRMLAHYMNDKEYTNEILNGDIHSHNQRIAGLESRAKAKTFIYALCYGAGDKKLSTILGGGTKEARGVREHFLDNLPAFKSLKDKVARAATRKYLKGLDGRKLFVRSEHAALNTLLQGAGAIVMKRALVLFNDYIKDLDAYCVANVHDEWQVEVNKDQADEVGKLGVQAIKDAGISFDLNCPLDGEYKVGGSWYETH